MDLLARREHSRRELYEKLLQRDFDRDCIESVLDQLVKDTLLSDERFAEAYVRSRQRKGFGPRRIQQELELRGVADNLIAEAVDSDIYSWLPNARKVWEKRFGVLPKDIKEKAKQIKFLCYRGFSEEITKMLYVELKAEEAIQ